MKTEIMNLIMTLVYILSVSFLALFIVKNKYVKKRENFFLEALAVLSVALFYSSHISDYITNTNEIILNYTTGEGVMKNSIMYFSIYSIVAMFTFTIGGVLAINLFKSTYSLIMNDEELMLKKSVYRAIFVFAFSLGMLEIADLLNELILPIPDMVQFN